MKKKTESGRSQQQLGEASYEVTSQEPHGKIQNNKKKLIYMQELANNKPELSVKQL